jgi:hypothetical protein
LWIVVENISGATMQKNPNEFDRSAFWRSPQEQQYANGYPGMYAPQPPAAFQGQRQQQPGGGVQPKRQARMPKAQAVALARTLKRWLLVVSLAGFASLSGLVAYHQAGATTSQKSSPSTQATPTATSSSQQDDNSFFNQQNGNNFGTNTSSSQGSSDGSNNSSPSAPASGSSVS